MIRDVERLFERQRDAWPLLAKGLEGLAQSQMRRIHIDWFDVFVRHIPHRITSTTAPVDRASIAKRPCFLCAADLPEEEEGVRLDDDFTIYCNPFPIVDHHLTIAHREHRPQGIAEHVGAMLDIAAALPGYFVIYNGPQCGASAPDHMHFQAGSRILFPIEKDTAQLTGIAVSDYARNVFLLRGHDRSSVADRMNQAIELLADITQKRPEPLINIAAFFERNKWTVYLFPRAKHRPSVFDTGQLTVSPASIDLCGVFVVPLARDFEKIAASDIAAIFREVTLPDDQFRAVVAKLGNEP